jgi:hypothetical protein
MTTFEFDTWNPHFNLLSRACFMDWFTVFDTVVDVLGFEWDGVNILERNQLCPGPVASIFSRMIHDENLFYKHTDVV